MSKIPKDMREKNKVQEMFEDNPELKQILFFGFYIIFFVFIVILLRGSLTNTNQVLSKKNSGYGISFNLKKIEDNNYHFNYKIIKNNKTIIYEGDRNKENQKFIKSGTPSINYYSQGNNYYLKNTNSLLYEKSINPMEFSKILEATNLKKMFIHGTYISKTEYINSSQEDYTYEISTTTLLRNLDQIETDIDSKGNTITAKLDKNGDLAEIDMDLTDYFHYYDQSIYEYKLIINYSRFGEIEKIEKEY